VCVRKNGRLALRPSCRARERTFDATGYAVAGPTGPAGPQGPAGDPATFPLRLVDSIDQEVGGIHQIHPSGFAWVAIARPPLEAPVLFFVTAKGFPPDALGQATVYYPSAACGGVPYIRDDRSDLARARVCGSAAYHSDALAGDVPMQSREYDYAGAQCPTGMTATPRATCCENYAETVRLVRPATRVDLVSIGLRPPFRAVKRQEVIP